MSIGSFDNGHITPCSNYWFYTFGSVLEENFDKVLERIDNEKIYKILCNAQHQLKVCSQCFTPWEIINLYLENLISLDELKKIHLYSFEGIETYFD